MKVVLFACVHNAGRSQMAAALFNQLADPAKARAVSAGTQPGSRVHPEVAVAMHELGVDLSSQQPQLLTDELAQTASILVTMGCGEACPVVSGVERDDWPLEDPKGKPIERVREIREEIAYRVRALLISRNWLPWTVRAARVEDRAAVEVLLGAAGLPLAGVSDHLKTFLVAEDANSRLCGVAGLELYNECALLRSVAVEESARSRGLGSALTSSALAQARALGARDVYLLTTTAADFFARRGFASVERSEVPSSVKQSVEFMGVCPDSATVMHWRSPGT